MIGKLLGTVFFLAIGAALMYGAMAYHVVDDGEERLYVPKQSLSLSDTFVDITDWTADDFKANPTVTAALIEAGHEDHVERSLKDRFIEGVLDAVKDKMN